MDSAVLRLGPDYAEWHLYHPGGRQRFYVRRVHFAVRHLSYHRGGHRQYPVAVLLSPGRHPVRRAEQVVAAHRDDGTSGCRLRNSRSRITWSDSSGTSRGGIPGPVTGTPRPQHRVGGPPLVGPQQRVQLVGAVRPDQGERLPVAGGEPPAATADRVGVPHRRQDPQRPRRVQVGQRRARQPRPRPEPGERRALAGGAPGAVPVIEVAAAGDGSTGTAVTICGRHARPASRTGPAAPAGALPRSPPLRPLERGREHVKVPVAGHPGVPVVFHQAVEFVEAGGTARPPAAEPGDGDPACVAGADQVTPVPRGSDQGELEPGENPRGGPRDLPPPAGQVKPRAPALVAAAALQVVVVVGAARMAAPAGHRAGSGFPGPPAALVVAEGPPQPGAPGRSPRAPQRQVTADQVRQFLARGGGAEQGLRSMMWKVTPPPKRLLRRHRAPPEGPARTSRC